MSEHDEKHGTHAGAGHDAHDDGHHINYTKIYVILLVLLVISILGPEIGIVWVTLITAFGIAFVKAYLVVQNFMHLRPEKAIVKWMLASSLLLMGLFFFGVAPDVMKHEGRNWVNMAAMAAVERGIPLDGEYAEEGDHAEDGEAAEEVAPEPAPAVAFSAQQAYQTTCALCHGATGAGDGPGGAALDPAPAAFTSADYWASTDRDQMFQVIKNGGASVGKSALMAAWGPLYDDEQINQIIDYIETNYRP